MRSFLLFLICFTFFACSEEDNNSKGPDNKIVCLGNSLTAGSYPQKLSELANISVINAGVGAQDAEQIAARFGAKPISVTIKNNTIPSEGSVSVTAKSINILYINGRYDGTALGSLCGVTGIMSTDKNGNWTFTRNTSGMKVNCPPESVFVPETNEMNHHIAIFWMGRNGFIWQTPESIMDNIRLCVDHLEGKHKKFLVLTVPNADEETEYRDEVNYKKMKALNDSIITFFPDNYLDIRSILVNSYDPNNPQDIVDFERDIPPSSLRADHIHLNDKGNAIVANAVYEVIKLKGWLD